MLAVTVGMGIKQSTPHGVCSVTKSWEMRVKWSISSPSHWSTAREPAARNDATHAVSLTSAHASAAGDKCPLAVNTAPPKYGVAQSSIPSRIVRPARM